MASHVGLTVIHPGGLEATSNLAASCRIDSSNRVIDIACGKGTTAVYLAERLGCRVVGVDISERLIEQAKSLARRRGLTDKVEFRVGDALDLPFGKDEFDAAVSQAMLVLVRDKQKAVEEAVRVTRDGRRVGWLELSWRKPPTEQFMGDVSNVLCAYCMKNVETLDGWQKLLERGGVTDLETQSFTLRTGGMTAMLADEGAVNACRIVYRYLTNGRIRNRMRTMNRFFSEHSDIFGYGIYVGSK